MFHQILSKYLLRLSRLRDYVLLLKNKYMIRHIVFLKLRYPEDHIDPVGLLSEVRYQLGLLPAIIPGIEHFEVREVIPFDSTSPELVLISDFADMDSLNYYLNHPAHLAFVDWNKDKCPKLAAVDYQYYDDEIMTAQ